MGKEGSADKTIREIRRRTRRKFSAEEKIRIVIERLRGEESVSALCRREGLAPPSHCRSCEHPPRWYDNVPLLIEANCHRSA